MFLLPLKANFPLPRIPWLTLLVCLVCAGVFAKQQSDWHDFGMALERFCNSGRSHLEHIVFDRIAASQGTDDCAQIMYSIANDPERDEQEVISEFARKMKPLTGFSPSDSREYVRQMLEDQTRRFKNLVPPDPDNGLAYYTGSWNPITMITSSFAHGGWGHIAFNLVFFFAFAATVEALVGPLWFIAFILVDSWFIGVTGSAIAALSGEHYLTLGLSGVVMGVIGLFAYLLPRGKIKCFFLIVVVPGFIAVPGWALALLFIGGDITTLLMQVDAGVINVMAHVMGGIGGYLFGVIFLRDVRERAIDVQAGLDRAEFESRFR